jgi:hypothetical protein
MPAVEIHPPEDQLIRAQKAGMLIEPSPSIPPSGMPLTIHLQQPNAKLAETFTRQVAPGRTLTTWPD